MNKLAGWQFDFTNPVLILASLLLLVSLLATLRAVRKRLSPRKPLRARLTMLLNVVAFGTLLILLLEPQHRHPAEQSVTLLTEGTDLLHEIPSNASRLYVAPALPQVALENQKLKKASWLLDIEQLQLREPALSSIEILGYGLHKDQWLNFENNIHIEFNPPPIYGFTAMQWHRSLIVGESLRITGHYQQADPETVIELRLLDPATNVVSKARIKNGQSFSLSTTPKTRGMLEYKLQAWISNSVQAEQIVTLEVKSIAALNIMIEQSAPSFETRQLKDFAASLGHRVLVNTTISKDKSINQTANLPGDLSGKPPGVLAGDAETIYSPQTLNTQDVLIMDGRALSNLSIVHKQWLMDAISNGLGLLVLADSALLEKFDQLNTNLMTGFDLSANSDSEIEVIPRLLTDQSQNWQAPLTTKAMSLTASNADVLIDDGQGRNLVVKRGTGFGNIAISLIGQSNSWLTSGNRKDWSEYWSALFATIARQDKRSTLLPQAGTMFERVNQRTGVCALAAEKGLVVSITPPETKRPFELKLATDSLHSTRQCAYFWPQNGGWHQLRLLSASDGHQLDQKSVYIFQPNQWLPQQRAKRVEATRIKAAKSNRSGPAEPEKWVWEPINLFMLWLLFVTASTLLWLERKLDIR